MTFNTSTEAGGVTQLPLAGGPFGRVRRQTADEERSAEAEILVLAFVDHGACLALIHPQREVLLLRQQLHRVVASIRYRLVAASPPSFIDIG